MNPSEHTIESLYQRSLTAHLPFEKFNRLQKTKILLGGLGGGSNIAELLVRKGFGQLIIADLDCYEPHNIRQRGSLLSTMGQEKTQVMQDRLLDINPHLEVESVAEGITLGNVEALVKKSNYVVDMLDLHALKEKVALHRAAREHGRYVLTAPSVINGAVLWVFDPEGASFEEVFGYQENEPLSEFAWSLLRRAIPQFPCEELEDLYRQAAFGKRSIPLDAVGVDQASVLTVSALENMVFDQWDKIILAPRSLQVDLSNPHRGAWVNSLDQKESLIRC